MIMIGGAARIATARTVRPIARAARPTRRRPTSRPPLLHAGALADATPASHPIDPAATGRLSFGQPSTVYLTQAIALRAHAAASGPAIGAAERRAAIAAYRTQIGDHANILGPVRPLAFRV